MSQPTSTLPLSLPACESLSRWWLPDDPPTPAPKAPPSLVGLLPRGPRPSVRVAATVHVGATPSQLLIRVHEQNREGGGGGGGGGGGVRGGSSWRPKRTGGDTFVVWLEGRSLYSAEAHDLRDGTHVVHLCVPEAGAYTLHVLHVESDARPAVATRQRLLTLAHGTPHRLNVTGASPEARGLWPLPRTPCTADAPGRWVRRDAACPAAGAGAAAGALEAASQRHPACAQPAVGSVGCIARDLGLPDAACEWLWAPYSCYVRRYDAQQARRVMRGRSVAVLGDSTTRFMWFALQRLLDEPTHPALQIQYGFYKSPYLQPHGQYSVRDRPGPYTWSKRDAPLSGSGGGSGGGGGSGSGSGGSGGGASPNTTLMYAMPKFYNEVKGRNLLADKTEALTAALATRRFDAVVLGFPLLGDVCNAATPDELYRMDRAHAQPPTEGLLGALQPNATYIWRSAPAFNEWHMRDHCLSVPLVLRANRLQAERYRRALPHRRLLDATQLSAPLYAPRHLKSQRQHVHSDLNDLMAQLLLAVLDEAWRERERGAAAEARLPMLPPRVYQPSERGATGGGAVPQQPSAHRGQFHDPWPGLPPWSSLAPPGSARDSAEYAQPGGYGGQRARRRGRRGSPGKKRLHHLKKKARAF